MLTEKLTQDLRALLSAKPRLLSDVIEELRRGSPLIGNRYWTSLPSRGDFESAVYAMEGVFVRSRQHGAGVAYYVATAPFELPTRAERGFAIVRRYAPGETFGAQVRYVSRSARYGLTARSSDAKLWKTLLGANKALAAFRDPTGWTVEHVTVTREVF